MNVYAALLPDRLAPDERLVDVRLGTFTLQGTLGLPPEPLGMVLFAHGSGSSRHSPRNRAVADRLREAGLGTLLIDLLTPGEARLDERLGQYRFDIGLLTERLLGEVDWLQGFPDTRHLRLGLFGASTGAAAALSVAAEYPRAIGAIVSRGGRPDLAGSALARVQAPTLLIVGGDDPGVADLNHSALAQLPGERRLELIPGAGHLFEEPGALETVAALARGWYARWLAPPA
jgi:pimeloyl-ACP methyl ester carboxylesterase